MSTDLDLTALAKESVWVDKHRYADAERDYYSGTNSSVNKQVFKHFINSNNYFENSSLFPLLMSF